MKELIQHELAESIQVKQRVLETLLEPIAQAASAVTEALRSGNKVLLAGNGGSAADAQHIAGEFVGRFLKERKALAAIALSTDTSVLTALANDYGIDRMFARQIEALGNAGDVFIAISTSGNSANILAAVAQAKTQGIRTIGLTGAKEGALASEADMVIAVPSQSTPRIQEAHITIGHIICNAVEHAFV